LIVVERLNHELFGVFFLAAFDLRGVPFLCVAPILPGVVWNVSIDQIVGVNWVDLSQVLFANHPDS
jgi:hypothetical protein